MTKGKMIHLRVPKKIHNYLEKASKSLYFSSTQDLVREILRNFVMDARKKEAIGWLKKNKGALNGKIKSMTKNEREKLLREYLEKDTSNILGEHNL